MRVRFDAEFTEGVAIIIIIIIDQFALRRD
jgi:hypothetical protein